MIFCFKSKKHLTRGGICAIVFWQLGSRRLVHPPGSRCQAQFDASVAQSVEQLIRNQQVAGSSPATSSSSSQASYRLRRAFFVAQICSSRAHSAAPRFKIVTADAGLRFCIFIFSPVFSFICLDFQAAKISCNTRSDFLECRRIRPTVYLSSRNDVSMPQRRA